MTARARRLALLAAIVVAAAGLRLAWHDWDGGHHLHPDERFLGMVVAAVELPGGIGEYLDSRRSPLNPANRGFPFYVYGDLPLLMTRAGVEGLQCLHTAWCGDRPPTGAEDAGDRGLAGRLCWPEGRAPALVSPGGATRVGRLLSSLLDLATLGWLWWLSRQLWGDRAALVAAALWAVTVLPIQHAHFATVDSIATSFGTAALACAVWAARTGGGAAFAAAGVAAGLAAACRINLAPAAGLVPLAAAWWLSRPEVGRAGWRRAVPVAVAGVALAAMSFRLAMPYAFDGAFAPDPRWVESMSKVRGMMAAPLDAGPPGVQWADRTPLVFALRNMVVWGMGIPLGLAALAGWGLFALDGLRRRADAGLDPALLVWAWATLQVGWYGAQPVMSMRYLLPAYPAMVALAAWMLVRPWSTAKARGEGWRPVVARAALPAVLLATAAWAWAFTAVYREPHTRVAASRWLLDAAPGGPHLVLEDGRGSRELDLRPLPGGDGRGIVMALLPERDAALRTLSLPRVDLVPAGGAAPSGWVRVRVAPSPDGRAAVVETAAEVVRGRELVVDLQRAPVRAGAWAFVVVDGMGPDETARLARPVVVGEHWDDGLPLRLDGTDPSAVYRVEQLHSFDPDGPAKRDHLLERLADADLVVLSSNRVVASIPRLPERWPLTTRFYRLLLSGGLGFEVAAELASYPRLGPLELPDSETTGALGLVPDPTRLPRPGRWTVPLPPAEEAFSVYDHPRVLILRKRDDFSLASAAEALGPFP